MTTYYEEVECKEKAKLISGYGYFNVCSESETAIIPAGAVFNYVVYDSNDIEAIPYCESDRPTKILEEHFSRHMQQHVTRVKKMSGNFYQLSYSTDFEDGSLCYKSR